MKKIYIFCFVVICLVTRVVAATDDELFDQGVVLLKQEQSQEAVEVFTRLIESVPDSPDAYRNRGVGYMKLNRYEEAIGDFEKAMALKPDLKDLYSNLGVAWYYKNEYHKAIEFYDKELNLRPDNHYGYFNRAICWAALDEFDLALKDVEKSLDFYPRHYLALCLKGELLVKTGKSLQARQAYEAAIALDPEQAYAKEQLEQIEQGKQEKQEKQTKQTKQGEQAVGGFSLQVGAYLGRQNADKMLGKIREKGYSAKILELTGSKGRHWFLVRTGDFATRAAAVEVMAEMKKKLGGPFVVRPSGRF